MLSLSSTVKEKMGQAPQMPLLKPLRRQLGLILSTYVPELVRVYGQPSHNGVRAA